MKAIFTFAVAVFLGFNVLAQDSQEGSRLPGQDEPVSSDILGAWRTLRPLSQNPYVVSYGSLNFLEDSMQFTVGCEYKNGVSLTARVEVPVKYYQGAIDILESAMAETRREGLNCIARVDAGAIRYRQIREDRMLLYNRQNGFQMEIIR